MWFYCNDPKFSNRQDWANRVDPDQTALKEWYVTDSSLIKYSILKYFLFAFLFLFFKCLYKTIINFYSHSCIFLDCDWLNFLFHMYTNKTKIFGDTF